MKTSTYLIIGAMLAGVVLVARVKAATAAAAATAQGSAYTFDPLGMASNAIDYSGGVPMGYLTMDVQPAGGYLTL